MLAAVDVVLSAIRHPCQGKCHPSFLEFFADAGRLQSRHRHVFAVVRRAEISSAGSFYCSFVSACCSIGW